MKGSKVQRSYTSTPPRYGDSGLLYFFVIFFLLFSFFLSAVMLAFNIATYSG